MDRTYLIKPALNADYPVVDYGKGIYLYDLQGKRYLDGASGAVTANIGHGVEEIVEAMKKQAEKVSFVYRAQFSSEPAEKLAEKIANSVPGDLNWSFFVNSGSEATETSMKIAIQHWQEKGKPTKNRILSRWVSYHGITMGALSMSGHPARRARFTSLLEDCPVIPPPYCYRCPLGLKPEDCGLQCARELETAIRRIGADNIAAFIAEPVVGAAGGALTPPAGYYIEIKEICDRHDILFIADEVMTGFGRTGTMLACEQWGVIPDIVALGKGMGAGYAPIAATLASERVMEPILNGTKSIMSGHTLSANPQSCAVSLAVLEYMDDQSILKEVKRKGDYLMMSLEQLNIEFPFIGDIRGKGLMIGVEFVEDAVSKKSFSRDINFTARLVNIAQELGLLIYPAGAGIDGISGDAVIISPPLTISLKEMDELVVLLKSALTELSLQLNDTREVECDG
ncbi:aspartate aminotransferase family protein [Mesobacillus zeae]|uniref:Aspartate aminotransferase family protein n=1 Tax=Mesobacillus zeae TaxID=1917180 RepID=A0A398B2W1_9BACI|nr:aspartate aminotransferase family protein [Mesobacillus zeae]RID84217.1 aspartate aminotransferase family protein [Mesobacillus zeae]